MATTLADTFAQARAFALLALLGAALTLSLMLGAGGAAAIARGRVADLDRRRLAGAALILWAIAGAIALLGARLLMPGATGAVAVGCALALVRLALATKFDLRAALPRAEDMKALLRAGFRPLIASALYIPAALTGRTLLGAALYAALLLAANVALMRDEAEGKRAAGHLTALALLMAAPLALPQERASALLGLFIAWLTAVSLTAGLRALFHLPSALYEAYLPVRARFIKWRCRAR